MSFFREMGFMAYPLTIVAAFLVIEIVRATRAVARADASTAPAASARIHVVLVWGVLGAALGILGTLVGVAIAAGFIERAGTINPGLVWGGMRVALSTAIVGMLLLGIASIAWLALQFGNGRRAAATG